MPFLGVFIFIKVRLKFGKIIVTVLINRDVCATSRKLAHRSIYAKNRVKNFLLTCVLSSICFIWFPVRVSLETNDHFFFMVLELSRCRFNLCMF